MEIFGVYIPSGVLAAVIVVGSAWIGGRYLYRRVRNSTFGYLMRAANRALKEEMAEDGGIDFKEYNIKEEVKKLDEEFDWDEFLRRVEDAFRKYCQAMSENDNRLLKSFETDLLFQRHNAIIQANKKERIRDVYKIHDYLGAKILQAKQQKQGHLTVEVRAGICHYKINENGTLLSGNQSDSRKEVYHLEFSKEATKKEKKESVNCPNCGAPHLVQSAGICQYCGTMIVTFKDNWLLCDLKKM